MLHSTRLNIAYPDNVNETDSADVPRDIASLVQWLDIAGLIYSGTFAARPVSTPGAPGIIGRFYWDTTNTALWFDYGTGWVQIYPVTPASIGAVDMGLLIALG